ncbi:MAG: ribonuclease HI family protein [Candidatus Freyarchaeota archaeon]|nr:ribonuclease HI family protein [Candidatus Jordarchaeia archaeon]
MTSKYVVKVDASSENPGRSVASAILYKDDIKIESAVKQYINITNNEAEYMAIFLGLKLFLKHREGEDDYLLLQSDSNLAVKQLNNEYMTRSKKMKTAKDSITEFIKTHKINVNIEHIRREENKEADELARKSLKKVKEVIQNENKNKY